MKLLVALSAFICATSTAPSKPIVVPDLHPAVVHAAPAVVHAAPAAVVSAPVAVVSSQSHAQDELGQYSYSYSNPLSSKVETKTVDGITRGGYAYLDSHGLVQNVNYVSDDVNGFRVAASNLPLGPVVPQHDEPLVAAEKAKAVAALHAAAAHDAAEAAIAHENEVSHGPVFVEAAPVAHTPTPAPTVFVPAVVHSTHAVPEVHVTPAPVTYVSHAPSLAPEVNVTPAPYHASTPAPPSPYVAHVTPSAYSAPAEHAHSYAIVELDSSDIPPPSPQAYFHPVPTTGPYSPTPSPQPTIAPTLHEEPAPIPEVVHSPSPSSVAYVTPEVHVPTPAVTPAPVIPAVHAAAPAAFTPLAHDAPVVAAPAVVHAAPAVVHAAPAAVVSAPVAVVSSQSHAQDELGQYSYSYSNPLSSKVETKTVDGITRGGYAYVDSHGLVQNVNYVSDDHNGFRVAASNLPTAAVPVDIPDSHDVAAAKHVFFAELAKAKAAAEAAPEHPLIIDH